MELEASVEAEESVTLKDFARCSNRGDSSDVLLWSDVADRWTSRFATEASHKDRSLGSILGNFDGTFQAIRTNIIPLRIEDLQVKRVVATPEIAPAVPKQNVVEKFG